MQSACAILYYQWPVWPFHIFLHYLINGTIFGKKVIEYKLCVLIFSTTFVWNTSHSKKNSGRCYHKMYTGPHVKCSLFLSDFNETWIFSIDPPPPKKNSNTSFHENSFSGSPVVPRTNMTKLIDAFRNFGKAPTNLIWYITETRCISTTKNGKLFSSVT